LLRIFHRHAHTAHPVTFGSFKARALVRAQKGTEQNFVLATLLAGKSLVLNFDQSPFAVGDQVGAERITHQVSSAVMWCGFDENL
jgi:hypothetical protein